MILTSITFLFLFLPLAFIVYRFAGRRGRPLVLLFFSLLFVWSAGSRALFFLLGITAFTYLSGLALRNLRGKTSATVLFVISVIIDFGILLFYKYGTHLVPLLASVFPSAGKADTSGFIMPLGLSFYIFQSVSYLADLRRGEEPLKNPVRFGIYMTFFPKFLSGPLVRLKDFRQDLYGELPAHADLAEGFERFVTGLCKKVILADQLGTLADVSNAFNHPENSTVSCLWLTAAAYTLQLYFDFAGYTDMAIGLGQLFGIRLPENFRDPYCCRSLTDFWRRWHISLSSWFRDYVYIPLGGSRGSSGRTVCNLLIVWLFTGMWHGSTLCYLFWGLGHAALLLLEKYLIRPERFDKDSVRIPCRIFGILYRIFIIVCIGLLWIFFRAKSLPHLLQIFKGLFGVGGLAFTGPQTTFFLQNTIFFLGVGILLASPLVRYVREPRTKICRGILSVIRLAAVLLAVSYVIRGAYNPFVYQIF